MDYFVEVYLICIILMLAFAWPLAKMQGSVSIGNIVFYFFVTFIPGLNIVATTMIVSFFILDLKIWKKEIKF